MGNIISGSDFTGRLGPASVYKMRGHDKLVIRSRGGATKKKIKTHPNFDATRSLNREWTLVTEVAASIRSGLFGLKPLADYNVSGPFNALVKKIQTSDTANEKGKRSVLFSRYPDFIGSFQFNRQTLFNSIVRQPLEININKSPARISVTIPVLQPSIQFFPNPRYAYYRVVISATAVSDQVWNEEANSFKPLVATLPHYKSLYTDWVPASSIQPAAPYPLIPANQEFSSGEHMIIIVGAGIQYGMPAPDGSVQPVPYAGAAQILKCV
jgi:hypothetical protein